MTYLAPRQGLFAIIILISFCLHSILLVTSTDQQLDERKLQTGKRMLTQLVEEIKLPLSSQDKVSLSVLTGRYTSESAVASLTITDNEDAVVLQTGEAQLLDGDTISRPVILGNEVIGDVTMTLRDTSNGEIIASQWVFILGSFIVHLLLWLIYGYIARPTRTQLAALSREVQDHMMLREQKQMATGSQPYAPDTRTGQAVILGAQNHEENNEVDTTTDLQPEMTAPTQPSVNITQALNQYVQSNKYEASNDLQASEEHELQEMSSLTAAIEKKLDGGLSNTVTAANSNGKSSAATSSLQTLKVQIEFYDPYDILDTLAPSQADPYYALCTQLLQRTIDELLMLPILYGVTLVDRPIFDRSGTTVTLENTGNGKVALAATMLAWGYKMLHDIASFKLDELERFHAAIYSGVSTKEAADNMHTIMLKNAVSGQVFVLLPKQGLKQLAGQVQLSNLAHPQSIYERDCALIEAMSVAATERLISVRDKVLLSAYTKQNLPHE